MAEMSQQMNQVLITMPEISSTSDSLAILAQTMADDRAYFTGMLEQLRGEMQELKLSQLEDRAFFTGMLEQLRGEIQELKLSGAKAYKQLIDETAGNALNPPPPTPPPCELSKLPPEIITDIFSRLPAADLVKFRYLNKSYNSLIQSKCFIKLHLLKTAANINETRIWRVLMDSGTRPLWSIKVEALDEYLRLKMSDKSAGDAVAPFSRHFQVPVSYSILGSCNGLFCSYSKKARKFLVCNPCTGAHKYYAGEMVIPDLSDRREPRFVWDQYGFGDDGTGRFKIVRLGRRHSSIKHDYAGQITVEITILTLGDSCFRQTEQMVPRMELFGDCLYLEGALHWVDLLDDMPADVKRGIIVFSLGKEKFEPMMPLPPFDDDDETVLAIFGLKVICGKLTATSALTNRSGSLVFEIWVMEIYGVKESWSRKIALSYPSDDLFGKCIEPVVELITILRNGSVIFTLGDDIAELAGRWVVYDPKEKTFSIIKYDPPPWPEATEYVETLVPPK